jgi:uncharacterized protein (UPF0335 family)
MDGTAASFMRSRASRRPNRTARERREQRLRAEARTAQRLLKALDLIASHRGCQLSRLGNAMRSALRVPGDQVPAADDVPSDDWFANVDLVPDGTNTSLSPLVPPMVEQTCTTAGYDDLTEPDAANISSTLVTRFDYLDQELSTLVNKLDRLEPEPSQSGLIDKLDKVQSMLSDTQKSQTIDAANITSTLVTRIDRLDQELTVNNKLDRVEPDSYQADLFDRLEKVRVMLSETLKSQNLDAAQLSSTLITRIDRLDQELITLNNKLDRVEPEPLSGLIDMLGKVQVMLSESQKSQTQVAARVTSTLVTRIDRLDQELTMILADTAKLDCISEKVTSLHTMVDTIDGGLKNRLDSILGITTNILDGLKATKITAHFTEIKDLITRGS